MIRARRWLLRPVTLLRRVERADLRPDLIAGLSVAAVLIPQSIAYAAVAELPPTVGLAAAVVAAIVGALWGSSSHLNTGPTNAASLLVLGALLPLFAAGTPEYIAAAAVLAVLAGLLRLAMGLGGLGELVRFVSSSVIVGFTAGAGVLIAVGQLRHLLGVDIPGSASLFENLRFLAVHVDDVHVAALVIGLGSLVAVVILRRVAPRLPAALLVLGVTSVLVGTLGLERLGVYTIGAFRAELPTPRALPLFDIELVGQLATAALAIASIGLVEAISVARTIAASSGQRIDVGQEMVGQGLANVASGLFGGLPASGSFTRSALNYQAGARTSLSNVFAGLLVLASALAIGPLAAYVPKAALAGIIISIAYRMVDREEIARVLGASRGDSVILITTFVATLVLPLANAVLLGIAVSFARYLLETSKPVVCAVVPDEGHQHLVQAQGAPSCPQLGIISIRGSLYFGAVQHVEDVILRNRRDNPSQRVLLLRMHSVDHCDVSGIHMLESIVRLYREEGGDVYMVRVRAPVEALMAQVGFIDLLGEDHFLAADQAISILFHEILDPAFCIYRCKRRIFAECHAVPRHENGRAPTSPQIPAAVEIDPVSPEELQAAMLRDQTGEDLIVVDVREDDEFRSGHIPGAMCLPLSRLLNDEDSPEIPEGPEVVLVCRTGRRSTRAGYLLRSAGYGDVRHLAGGVLAWRAAGLPVELGQR